MNLFRVQERPVADSNFAARFPMNGIQSPKRFSLVVRNVDSRNSLDESVADIAKRFKRRKKFDA